MKSLHKKIEKDFDLYVALLMGLVSVLTAFFAFCASMWGSTSVANYSKANTELNQANTTYLEYNTAFVKDDLRELRLMSGGLSEKQAEIETEKANEEIDALFKEYEEFYDKSDKHMQIADEANAQGDKFQLVTVILATILFLASMSITTKNEKNKFVFFYFSVCLLIFTLLYSLSFNFPFFI